MSTTVDPDEVVIRLPLTPAELKVVHAALRSYMLDFGHDEHDVHAVVRAVLAKLPDSGSIRAIDLDAGI